MLPLPQRRRGWCRGNPNADDGMLLMMTMMPVSRMQNPKNSPKNKVQNPNPKQCTSSQNGDHLRGASTP
ncbi:hypothetical protein VTJ04DRAFT_9275 [Mycothermus thermophilus]|uniref:uncharacterized protein n=1 Tax=Humicola insolens TaxID=85995 RepID=UPI00374450D7